ncbi:MAG: hypothetical protein ACI8RD_005919 [Bacillariaceae sp.]|jgi:hypothetical protein
MAREKDEKVTAFGDNTLIFFSTTAKLSIHHFVVQTISSSTNTIDSLVDTVDGFQSNIHSNDNTLLNEQTNNKKETNQNIFYT